jgi:hypothetical protein
VRVVGDAKAKWTNEVSMTMKQAEVKQSCRFLLHVVRLGTVNFPSPDRHFSVWELGLSTGT